MRRELTVLLLILLASTGLAAAANVVRHKIPWIRAVTPPPAPDTPGATGLTADEVLEHLRNQTAIFIDAREDHDYADGHLCDAIHLPSSAVYDNIERVSTMVPLEWKLIVYCGGGDCKASHDVARVLGEFDFEDVEIYENGWEEVESSGRFDAFIIVGEEP